MNVINYVLIFSVGVSLLIGSLFLPNNVLFESLESKTPKGNVIFNKISLVQDKSVDIWKMNQSHHGLDSEDWDELEIRVNRKDNSVSYHQLLNGKDIKPKIKCLICHANGPRAIRPNYNSKLISLNLLQKLQIFHWNTRIKTYGRLKHQPTLFAEKDFSFQGASQKKFKLESCNSCHGGDKLFARNSLKLQNIMTIRHLLKTKQMPPWPYKISDRDQKYLEQLLNNQPNAHQNLSSN